MFKIASTAVALAAGLVLAAPLAQAKECVKKGAIGEASTEAGAKFQVDEALLQAVSWTEAWAPWFAAGGKGNVAGAYNFGPRTYRCSKSGSLGWTCRGQAVICRR